MVVVYSLCLSGSQGRVSNGWAPLRAFLLRPAVPSASLRAWRPLPGRSGSEIWLFMLVPLRRTLMVVLAARKLCARAPPGPRGWVCWRISGWWAILDYLGLNEVAPAVRYLDRPVPPRTRHSRVFLHAFFGSPLFGSLNRSRLLGGWCMTGCPAASR